MGVQMWVDKILDALFGGIYDKQAPGSMSTSPSSDQEVAMSTFRYRISSQRASAYGYKYERAPGFDYMRWKPHGKHRMRYNPNGYAQQCDLLAPYVQDVTYAAWLGTEERRWAGVAGEAPPPAPLSRAGTRSLGGSRDTIG